MAELLANELMEQAEQNTATKMEQAEQNTATKMEQAEQDSAAETEQNTATETEQDSATEIDPLMDVISFLIDHDVPSKDIIRKQAEIQELNPNLPRSHIGNRLMTLYERYGVAGFANKLVNQAQAEQRENGNNYKPPFEVFSMGDIVDNESLQPPQMIIKDLLAPGLTVFAAATKSGKSWMSLQMALNLIKGEDIFFRKTQKVNVLYLGLEDAAWRLKDRVKKLLGTNKSGKDILGLYATTSAQTLKNGLLNGLQYYIDMLNTKVIIIDTLAKVKDISGKSQDYAFEYSALGQIQKFALDNDVAVIVVHHTRKQSEYKSENPFDAILGSTAISGAADAMWVLEKKRNGDATLFVTGRDVPQQELSLRWDEDFYMWTYMGNAEEQERQRQKALFEKNPLTIAVKNMLETSGGYFAMTSKELVEYANVRISYVGAAKWIRNNIDFFEDMGIQVEPPADTNTGETDTDGKKKPARNYKFTQL